MQIKKFEARSMKEALEMIKTQLGPDAVILSAKEVSKGFGLGGEKSIEITAAYSEKVLQQKKYVESRMPDHMRDQFTKTPAKNQKEIIQKSIESRLIQMQRETMAQKPIFPEKMTQRKYVDIDREEQATQPISNTLRMAQDKYQNDLSLTQEAQKNFSSMEVNQLKGEIEQLKTLITQFKQIPQNFVQAHPGAELGVNYHMSSSYSMLVNKGLMPEIAAEILVQAQNQITLDKQKNKSVVDAYMARYILKSISLSSEDFEQFHLFLGPSGAGKTTTMIKYASDLVLNHKKRVALISTDTIKIGADEQMKIYSQILNLPFIAIRSEQDWYKILPYLNQVDHVLVDFASLNLKSNEEISYLKKMMPPVAENIKSHLVLSATAKDIDLLETYKRYKVLNVADAIFTSLDEASVYGNIYNFNQKTHLPLFAFGIGSRTPEDFERATAERVLDLILDITKTQTEYQVQEV